MAIAIPSGILCRAMPRVTMDASDDGDEVGDIRVVCVEAGGVSGDGTDRVVSWCMKSLSELSL